MPVFSRLATAVQLFSIFFITPILGAATDPQFDYVIVGGGITGLVVANRLTEDRRSMLFLLGSPGCSVLTVYNSYCPCHRGWRYRQYRCY